ncbi:MAG TPA: lytic transglycosylase domain-containing protein [Thermoanaerobaculia bacterium]|nr:lytic transglycosylase domain-containing protein [Thermoanaerobaculia bacterium]
MTALAVPAGAEVKTRVRADGTLEIYNDAPSFSFHARAMVLQPVPRSDWDFMIRLYAAERGVDARLVQAIMQVESAYNARAVSRTGARGLMQLMPDTAKLMRVEDSFDAEQNIRGGVAYLRQMIDRFGGRLELAIAAYNAGPTAVQRHDGVPPYAETRDYVDRVLTLYRGTSGSPNGLVVLAASGPVRANALVQSDTRSALQRALVAGSLRTQPVAAAPAAAVVVAAQVPPPAMAPAPVVVVAVVAPATPATAPRPAPAVPVAVPASLPAAPAPVPAQPATGA